MKLELKTVLGLRGLAVDSPTTPLVWSRPTSVNDVGNHASGFHDQEETSTEYLYDENGNMERDYNKEIQSIGYNYLNLPQLITFEDNSTIEYTYDAAGTKWQQRVTQGSNIKTTDYMGEMIIENDTLQLVLTPEGRMVASAVANEEDFQYQYFLKDHLGNVRLTFGAEEHIYEATMESELASQEEAAFGSISDKRQIDVNYNHTPEGTVTNANESIMLNANLTNADGTRRMIGATKGLKVASGDVVDMEVFAKYNTTCGVSETAVNTFLFAALAGGLGLSSTGETSTIYNAFNSVVGSTALINQNSCDVPAAYINYIFFDENYANPQVGFDAVTSAAQGSFEKLTQSLTAPSAGYLYIYVSNESTLNVNVHFDDMKITHSSNQSIVGADDYYPFGLTMQGVGIGSSNQFKYNGKEEQDELELNLIDYGWRMYDATLGRWHAPDPLSDQFMSLSPYNYVANNPIIFTDPDGRIITGDTDRVEDLKDAAKSGIKSEKKTQARLNNRIDKRAAKGKSTRGQERRLAKSQNRQGQLEGALAEIGVLESSEIEFHVVSSTSSSSGVSEGGTTYDSNNDRINIDVPTSGGLSLLAHELKHGFQFQTGKVDFFKSGGGSGILYDITDEIDAYKRQYAFNSGGGTFSGISQYSQINKSFVRSLPIQGYSLIPQWALDKNSSLMQIELNWSMKGVNLRLTNGSPQFFNVKYKNAGYENLLSK